MRAYERLLNYVTRSKKHLHSLFNAWISKADEEQHKEWHRILRISRIMFLLVMMQVKDWYYRKNMLIVQVLYLGGDYYGICC